MKLRSIHLENFRSYKKINLKIENNKFIVLTGKNGSGKTNLLEAISFLSPGKGFKNCRLDEVINTNTNLNQCSIFFVIENGNEKNEIGISFANESTGNRRRWPRARSGLETGRRPPCGACVCRPRLGRHSPGGRMSGGWG